MFLGLRFQCFSKRFWSKWKGKNIYYWSAREGENLVIFGGTDRFVRDDVFADGEAHTGAEAKRGGDGAAYDAVSAHDSRSYVAQSPCHFPFFLFVFPWFACFSTLYYQTLAFRFFSLCIYCDKRKCGLNDSVWSYFHSPPNWARVQGEPARFKLWQSQKKKFLFLIQ